MGKRIPAAVQETTFGGRLAPLRRAAGYTQVELAQALEISQRMVAYYESPAANPPANPAAGHCSHPGREHRCPVRPRTETAPGQAGRRQPPAPSPARPGETRCRREAPGPHAHRCLHRARATQAQGPGKTGRVRGETAMPARCGNAAVGSQQGDVGERRETGASVREAVVQKATEGGFAGKGEPGTFCPFGFRGKGEPGPFNLSPKENCSSVWPSTPRPAPREQPCMSCCNWWRCCPGTARRRQPTAGCGPRSSDREHHWATSTR